jgi:hypothetical protein
MVDLFKKKACIYACICVYINFGKKIWKHLKQSINEAHLGTGFG